MDLLRIRHVEPDDEEELGGLYAFLDTCNGSPENVRAVIEASRSSTNRDIASVTFVCEHINPASLKPHEKLSGSGRLIRPAQHIPSAVPVQMYEEDENGLRLTSRDEDVVEFAGMVVHPDDRGTRVGKSITILRALVARRFAGIFGVDNVLVEFLPPYDDNETKKNAFWRDLILPYLSHSGRLDALKKRCGEMLDRAVETDQDLLLALVRDMDSNNRNAVVAEFFPKTISGDTITADARHVTQTIGPETMGAYIHLERAYGGELVQVGHFPIDGGSNYTAPIEYGALGDRTVRVSVATRSSEDTRIMEESPEHALIFNPVANTIRGLRDLFVIVTPGIFGPRVAKIPPQTADLLGISEGDEVTYLKLPSSSRKS